MFPAGLQYVQKIFEKVTLRQYKKRNEQNNEKIYRGESDTVCATSGGEGSKEVKY